VKQGLVRCGSGGYVVLMMVVIMVVLMMVVVMVIIMLLLMTIVINITIIITMVMIVFVRVFVCRDCVMYRQGQWSCWHAHAQHGNAGGVVAVVTCDLVVV